MQDTASLGGSCRAWSSGASPGGHGASPGDPSGARSGGWFLCGGLSPCTKEHTGLKGHKRCPIKSSGRRQGGLDELSRAGRHMCCPGKISPRSFERSTSCAEAHINTFSYQWQLWPQHMHPPNKNTTVFTRRALAPAMSIWGFPRTCSCVCVHCSCLTIQPAPRQGNPMWHLLTQIVLLCSLGNRCSVCSKP